MELTVAQFNALPDVVRYNSRQQHRLQKLQGKYRNPYPFMGWDSYMKKLERVFSPLPPRIGAEDPFRTTVAQRTKLGGVLEVNAPARCLSPELGEALLNTKVLVPPKDRVALPAFHLFLPPGLLDVDGVYPRAMACVDRGLMFESAPDWWVEANLHAEEAPGMAFVLLCDTPEGKPFNAGSSVDYGLSIDSITSDQALGDVLAPGLLGKARHLLSTLLTFMACEADRETVELAVDPDAPHPTRQWKPGKRPLTPVVIGDGYRPRTVAAEPAAGSGSDRQVAAHWRSGHFHTVLHGQGKTQRRLQWFEPVFVNAPWKAAA